MDCPACPPVPVFHTDVDGNWDLARLPFAGEDRETIYNLTRRQGRDLAPASSPQGGQWIAFQSDRHGQWDIYTMDLYGHHQTRQTTHPAHDVAPAWSPQCTVVGTTCATGTLAFQSDRQGNWDLFRLDVGTNRDPVPITTDPGNDVRPVWRPDGSALAYQSDREGHWDIYAINADGSDERQITNDPADEIEPAWSPDGRAIAYVSNRRGDWDLYVAYLSGGLPFYLMRDEGDDRRPVWSPDSRWIAFQSNRDGQWDIYAYGVYARVLRRLTDDPAADEAPAWNCDGSRVIFHSDRDGDGDLYTVALNNPRDIIRLTEQESAEQAAPGRSPLDDTDMTTFLLPRESLAPVPTTPAEPAVTTWPTPSAAPPTATPLIHPGVKPTPRPIRPDNCPACIACPCSPAAWIDCPACPSAPIFHTDADGNWDLARLPFIGEDSGAIYNLTRRRGRDLAPSFSPQGGQWIAFQSDRDGQWDIYTMDLDGRHQTRQTKHTAHDVAPAWSPECAIVGTTCVTGTLAFQSDRQGNWDLFRLDVGTGRPPVPITTDEGDDVNPFWKPNGSALAFQSNRAGNWDIFTVRTDGSDERQRTDDPADDVDPAWSPNGLAIVYVSNRRGNWDLYLLNPNSDAAQKLTENVGDNRLPTWSPDGRKIAFQSNRDGQWDIYAYDAISGTLRRLTDHPGADQAPAWNCDGSRVLFQSDRDGDAEIYAVSMDDPGDVVQLTDRDSQEKAPLWFSSLEDGSRALAPELAQRFEGQTAPTTEARETPTGIPPVDATTTPLPLPSPTRTHTAPSEPTDTSSPFNWSNLVITLGLIMVAAFVAWFVSARRRALKQAPEQSPE